MDLNRVLRGWSNYFSLGTRVPANRAVDNHEDETGDESAPTGETPADPQEIQLLREVERNLAAVVDGTDVDPKVQVILHYLREQNWLERNGAIVFSQYRTTAEWVLEALCAAFPNEPVSLYAGGAASFVKRGEDRRTASREQIKGAIQRGDIRLVCATDAACEGLNLQRLGAQVNVDLPWNPSRLEQRKGGYNASDKSAMMFMS